MVVSPTNGRAARAPAVFLPHGGGPIPLLGDFGAHTNPMMKMHGSELTKFLSTVGQTIQPKPRAILLISAHWEEKQPTVLAQPNPPLLYDYYGFPPEAYNVKYPAPGSPELAQRTLDLLWEAGIQGRQETQRGFDHGVFVPLKLMYPQADIPIVQLSLLESLDPQAHIRIGEALAPLRDEGVAVIGSGTTFHNAVGVRQPHAIDMSLEFDLALTDVLTNPAYSPEERMSRLAAWSSLPHARYCHPREEHLAPVFVVLGAARGAPGKCIWQGKVFTVFNSGYRFD